MPSRNHNKEPAEQGFDIETEPSSIGMEEKDASYYIRLYAGLIIPDHFRSIA